MPALSPKGPLAWLALLLVLGALGEARLRDSSQHRHRHHHQLAPRRPDHVDARPDYDEYADDEEAAAPEEHWYSLGPKRPAAPRRRYEPHQRSHPRAGGGPHRPLPPAHRRGSHRKRYDDEPERPRARYRHDQSNEDDEEGDGDDEEFDDEYLEEERPAAGPRGKARRPRYHERRREPERDYDYGHDYGHDYGYDEGYDEGYEADDEDDEPRRPARRPANKFDEWLRRTRPQRPADGNGSRPLGDEPWPRDDESPLKTYDEIIRRLTEDATTPRPGGQVKRNTDLESHLRRDAFGNLKYERGSNLVGPKDPPDDEEAQADANMDYADDETDEYESPVTSTTTSTTTPSPPTTRATTTTTTTTTQRVVHLKEPARSYDAVSTGAQYNGYQAKNDYPPMSAHSALKWQYLGTRDKVKETRNSMTQFGRAGKSAEMISAQNHAMRVAKEGSCNLPRVKVIPVREIYQNSTAIYIPHCAILHRCSDDTGCCRSETLTCEAKSTQRIELYFYATYIGGRTEIEKLSFTNHTECECRERKDIMSDKLTERTARHYPSSPQNIVRPPPRKPCRCPTLFTPKITIDGACECSCIENDQDCLRMLRGKVILGLNDRVCIQKEQCAVPNCTFGEFIRGEGRCPRKTDIFKANHRTHFNYHSRRS